MDAVHSFRFEIPRGTGPRKIQLGLQPRTDGDLVDVVCTFQ
jgi:hypothetical protein